MPDKDESKTDATAAKPSASRWIEPTDSAHREVIDDDPLESADPPRELPDPELSANARVVLERRYLERDDAGDLSESPRQMYWRVARHVARAELAFEIEGESEGDAQRRALNSATEFYALMATRRFLPNSPTLRNAGSPTGQLSACFVLPIEDSFSSICSTLESALRVHASGGGTGFDFSELAPRGEPPRDSNGDGSTDGPVAFLRAYASTMAAIRQGAFRAGANMGILRVDHPDLLEFLHAKDRAGEIENFNISVALTDKFLERLDDEPDAPHEVVHPRTGAKLQLERDGRAPWTVAEVWEELVRCAHATGEPGLFFVDRVNAANPIPHCGNIVATNPCGEQPLHAYDSCNLGSINLAALVRGDDYDADFGWDELRETVRVATRFLDDVVEVNQLPLTELRDMSRKTRRIGLGVMGFADALFKLRLPYDSEEGCAFGEQVMRVVAEECDGASAELAESRGSFGAWEGSHFERDGRPMRNAFRTTVAPTGTISILAGCSGGIEPLFSLAFTRQVMRDADGEPTRLREVNEVFEEVAREQGFWSESLIEELLERGSARHLEDVPEILREVFVTARDVAPMWHLRMQEAFQRHCDSGISKTINFPHEATLDDVRDVFDAARASNVRGLTCYRDGSRDVQPMALSNASSHGSALLEPRPIELPAIIPSLRIRQRTPFGNMHVKVSVDPAANAEREVFAQLGKGGELANSDLEAISRMLSLWLRSGGRLETALEQLEGIGSSLTVPTADGRILSLADGLAQALHRYREAKERYGLEALLLGRVPAEEWASEKHSRSTSHVPDYRLKCPSCESDIAFREGCASCPACGWSQC